MYCWNRNSWPTDPPHGMWYLISTITCIPCSVECSFKNVKRQKIVWKCESSWIVCNPKCVLWKLKGWSYVYGGGLISKQLYEWYFLSVCPSVRLSVCPSVRLSHLFDYVPIIVSSWNFQELSHWTRVRSMQKVKVRGQRSRSQRSRPNFSFPDCNSSLNSHMMMKWYI